MEQALQRAGLEYRNPREMVGRGAYFQSSSGAMPARYHYGNIQLVTLERSQLVVYLDVGSSIIRVSPGPVKGEWEIREFKEGKELFWRGTFTIF